MNVTKETLAKWTGKDEPKEPKTWHQRLLDDKDATGEMSVLGKEGDTRHFWNIKKKEDVKIAKEVFQLYRDKGYLAFRMDEDGEAGDQLDEFDPKAGCILFLTPMKGG